MLVSCINVVRRDHQAAGVIVLTFFLSAAVVYLWQRSLLFERVINFREAEQIDFEFRLDINQGDWAEFANLPGIGESLGRQIVGYRDSLVDRRFRCVEQLLQVTGIGEKKLEAIRAQIIVGD